MSDIFLTDEEKHIIQVCFAGGFIRNCRLWSSDADFDHSSPEATDAQTRCETSMFRLLDIGILRINQHNCPLPAHSELILTDQGKQTARKLLGLI